MLMTARGRRLQGLLPALMMTVLVLPATASGQSASDQAAAEALFKQGRDLMADGQYAIACPKFVESQRLDPAPGTLLNLATCYEKNGQIASAWVTFKEAAAAARQADQPERARMARDKAAEIEPNLPTLTIVVPAAADRPDLQVRRDGVLVGRPEWGTPIPVDPGAHVVEAGGPGLRTWQGAAAVPGASAKTSIEVPVLEPAPAAQRPAEPKPPTPAAAVALPSPTSERVAGPPMGAAPGSGQRAAGWIVGGVGLAGVAAGAIFGGVALSNNGAASSGCVQAVCSSSAYDSIRTAKLAATASDVGFAVGGALVLTGVVVTLAAPRRQPTAGLALSPAWFGPGTAGGLLRASF